MAFSILRALPSADGQGFPAASAEIKKGRISATLPVQICTG